MARSIEQMVQTAVLPDMSHLTKRNYTDKVAAWARAKGGKFPVLDANVPEERKAMEAWLAFWSHLGLRWKVKEMKLALDGRGPFESRWTVPTRFPSDLTGNTNDDFRGKGAA